MKRVLIRLFLIGALTTCAPALLLGAEGDDRSPADLTLKRPPIIRIIDAHGDLVLTPGAAKIAAAHKFVGPSALHLAVMMIGAVLAVSDSYANPGNDSCYYACIGMGMIFGGLGVALILAVPAIALYSVGAQQLRAGATKVSALVPTISDHGVAWSF